MSYNKKNQDPLSQMDGVQQYCERELKQVKREPTNTLKDGLPNLTHARHSFFRTISNKASLMKKQEQDPLNQEILEREHQRIFRKSSNKVNVYDIEYQNIKSQKKHKRNLNSTYRKMIMSSSLAPKNSSQNLYYTPVLKSSQYNKFHDPKSTIYNTVDSSVERVENSMFCPRVKNQNVGKKKSRILQQYMNRYNVSPKQQKSSEDYMNVTNCGVLNDRIHYQKLQQLKDSLNREKKLYAQKKKEYQAKALQLSKNRYVRPIKKSNKILPQNKQSYGPWKNPESEIDEFFIY